MATIAITRAADVRAGDMVTMTDAHGGVYTGPARHSETVGVVFGNLGWAVDHPNPYWTFVSATREVPDLPTEPGSVIVNATIRGEAGHTAILNDNGDWFTPRLVNGVFYFHAPDRITAWEPARIVPDNDKEDLA